MNWHSADQLNLLELKLKQIPQKLDSSYAVTIFMIAYRAANPDSWKMSGKKISLELKEAQGNWDLACHVDDPEKMILCSLHLLKVLHEGKYALFRIHTRVISALYGWHFLKWPLAFVGHIPSVEEMLRLQVAGGRFISFLYPKFPLSKIIEGRPIFSFFIHDLMHADHFFSDPEHYQGQVEFYREVQLVNQAIKEKPSMITDLEILKKWEEDWEYLLSDMNGHPAYLRKCMQNLLHQRHGAAGFDAYNLQPSK
ncbi:MAG: hypothetical protein QE271_09880 [Bacteriovoracaceae bacterium]|nr:hypothetical protein [Bacteriovoracaceae bacterium]